MFERILIPLDGSRLAERILVSGRKDPAPEGLGSDPCTSRARAS